MEINRSALFLAAMKGDESRKGCWTMRESDKNLTSFTDWCGRTIDLTPALWRFWCSGEQLLSCHLCAYYKHFLHEHLTSVSKAAPRCAPPRGDARPRHPMQGRPRHSKKDHLSTSALHKAKCSLILCTSKPDTTLSS